MSVKTKSKTRAKKSPTRKARKGKAKPNQVEALLDRAIVAFQGASEDQVASCIRQLEKGKPALPATLPNSALLDSAAVATLLAQIMGRYLENNWGKGEGASMLRVAAQDLQELARVVESVADGFDVGESEAA